MGGGPEYEYATDIGREANKYNEDMMRELLEIKDSARGEENSK